MSSTIFQVLQVTQVLQVLKVLQVTQDLQVFLAPHWVDFFAFPVNM